VSSDDQKEKLLEVRFVDMFAEGVRYEFKSVERISSAIVKGEKGKFGELQKDIITLLGTTVEEAFERMKNVKWVFDSTKLGEKSMEEITDQLMKYLRNNPPFNGWPRLDELEKRLKDIVELFRPR
jgi:hypothetical protein